MKDNVLKRFTGIPGMRRLWKLFPFGTVPTRVRHDVWDRPHYAYGVYSAAVLARRLGVPGVTVIEFGVAGGNGLISLEKIADRIARYMGIKIATFGFDTGQGMPCPKDYRDLPYVWNRGFYQMDRERLERELISAKLVIGNIESTLGSFVAPYPIGFIAFDLDYYSSTKTAFRVFEADHLPRVHCYFDDIIWPEIACHNDYIGELCAIREFNEEHRDEKLCPIPRLRNVRLRPMEWNDQMYAFHDFRHPLYCVNVNQQEYSQIPLESAPGRRGVFPIPTKVRHSNS